MMAVCYFIIILAKAILDMKASTIQRQPKPLCSANHQIASINFCRRCAAQFNLHKDLDRVFFCSTAPCFTADDLKLHSSHRGERFPVNTGVFLDLYSKFIEFVKLSNRMRFSHYILKINEPKIIDNNQINEIMLAMITAHPPCYNTALRPNLGQVALTIKDLEPLQYRKWIVTNHFWEKVDSPTVAVVIQQYVRSLFEQNPGPNPGPIPDFPIDIDPPLDLRKELETSKLRVAQLGREKLLTEFFLQVTACFSNEDIDKNLKQCARIESELGGGMTFLLRLGKLKALELHDDCSKQMKAVLGEINLSLLNQREKELFYYFSAIAEWEYVRDPTNQSNLFLDARNKKHYKLLNAQNFVNFLNKAIDINKNPVYLAARAIGYMTLKQYDRAATDFEAAQKLSYSSDAMDNNDLLNRITRKLEPKEETLTQELHNRKTEYIMGLCKVLEKKRKYRELRRCCEELSNREPKNIAFRVSLLRALLKLKDTDAARHQLSEIKDLKELPANEVENFDRRIQLLRAYEQEELGNYSDAEGKLEHAARVGQPSASYWFNYAAFLFKHRNERENNEKALSAINRALEIRQKREYFQLKYMLLFMMGNMEEAAKIQTHMTDPKFVSMKEYVDGNL